MPIRRIRKDEVHQTSSSTTSPGTSSSTTRRPHGHIADAAVDGSSAEPATAKRPSKKPNKLAIREKREPTGDYEVGWCRPPVEHRFKGKPGPGRPKGSVSQDTLLRKHLNQKRKIRVDGKERLVPMRELLVMTATKKAIEGDKELGAMLAESLRLFPDQQASRASGSGLSALTQADKQLLSEFFSGLGLEPLSEPDKSTDEAEPGEEED